MPPAAAAVDIRSPMDSSQQSQNPNSDYPLGFGAIPSTDFSENRNPSSNSSSFDGPANVTRNGPRARPRLAKQRKQQTRSRTVASSELVGGAGFNPFRLDSGRVGASNGVSSVCCGSGSGSGDDNNGFGFGFSNGDVKFESVGFVFGAKKSGVELNSGEEMRVNGEKDGKSVVDNVGFVFRADRSDSGSNSNQEKRENDECGDKLGSESGEAEKCGDLGSFSISEKREVSEKVSTLEFETSDVLKTGNGVEFGRNGDSGFVFGASWFNSGFGKLVSDIGENMKVESGVESSNVKVTAMNFDINGDRSLNENCDKGGFVFGNCESTKTRISDLGKSLFENSSNVASGSSTSPLFTLPDEIRKMKIDDSDNVDVADKTEDSDKNSSANPGVAFVFRSSEKGSDSLNRSSAACASIGVQAGVGTDFDVGQFPQGHVNEDTQRNASAAPSSFSSINFDFQPNGSVSEIHFMGGLENKDGDCSTSNPDGLGASFTAFSTPKWDPSCFEGNLFPEINKNLDFSVKGKSVKDKRSKKKKGKLKPPSLSKQNPGQDHVPKESSSQENPDTPGYTNSAPLDLHSKVPNDRKDEDLANADGADINKMEQRCREQNEENFCCRNESSFGCDCPSKGLFSGVETTCSSSKTEQFCSSSVAGAASTETQTGFSSNMEDTKEKCFTFSASSPAEGSLPATATVTKRPHRKKSRAKVGRDPSLNIRSSAAQSSPTSTSSRFDTEHKSEAHEQVKQGHISFSAAIQETCEKLRLRGNQAYAKGELSRAEDLYTHGIISVPSSERSGCCLKPLLLCYSNRAATRRSLGRIREALGDSLMTIALDPSFLKAQMRAANCHLVLGEVEDAMQYFNKCLESGGGVCLDRKLMIEAAEGLQKAQKVAECTNRSAKIMEQRTFDAALSALEIIDDALSISSYSEKLLEMKAEALIMLRKYEEAIQQCEQSLNFAEKNFASLSTAAKMEGSGCESYSTVRLWRWCLISRCYFHLGRLEAALDLLQKLEKVGSIKNKYGFKNLEWSISLAVTIRELLRLKNAGNESFRTGKYTDAIEHYTIALSSNVESRPFAAICLCNRAAAYQALGQIADAIADCSLAIALDGNYAKGGLPTNSCLILYKHGSFWATLPQKPFLEEPPYMRRFRDYGQAASDLQRLVSILENQSGEKVKQSGTPGRSTSSMKELRQAQRHLPSMEEEAKHGIPLDFYMILGIKPSDTASDIKKAYRKAALRHHPDKAGQFLARSESGDEGRLWKEISQEVHKDADRLFKMIGEAYAVLSDSTKRSQYDLEEDLRKTPKECHVSSSYRRASDVHSPPFGRSSNRRNWQENWKTYGNSQSRW
uniref:J domain-containing protein n=1 Tax=Fagus sylvatica TaxID=28930 RepID=A0A2N9FIS3_FAGSY